MDRDYRRYTGVVGGIYGGTRGDGRPAGAGGSTGGTISGVKGTIKWHEYTAAAIEGYTVRRSPDGHWSLTATVVLHDAFNLEQRPLTFVAQTNQGAWRWPIETFQLVERHHLTARLGPLETP